MKISSQVLTRMIRHARREAPLECCGALAGIDGSVITTLFECRNERADPSSFAIPAEELFSLFRELRESSRPLLGFYHSHPEAPACPSRRDAEEFYYPEVSYWIISLQNRRSEVRCFRWQDEGFVEQPFEVVPSPAQRDV